jgi:hypothetical protein
MTPQERSSRKARTSKHKTPTRRSDRIRLSDLGARLKAPPHAGGPIRNIHPTAEALQRLYPLPSVVTVKSGLASRGAFLRSGKWGTSGFRLDMPAPDPRMGTVVWATMSFDWAFYGWQSNIPINYSDHSVRINGSVDWNWFLTGHPAIFPTAPIFLSDNGRYTFYMDLAPGEGGFDAGWLTPPRSGSYSNEPDKTDASMTSPLQRLLAMNVNGALMLWFAVDYENQTPRTSIGYPWGPNTLHYAYAYVNPVGTMANE